MEELYNNKKRGREESGESEFDLPEVKRLRDDLLLSLDDSDPDPATHDLDSVMKSFEEEISASSSSSVPVVDLTSDSGDSQVELGYLLEASDDELGLPPAVTSSQEVAVVKGGGETELIRVDSDSSGIGELWGFEEQMTSFDSFELGIGDNYSEFVVYDGLFEYSDVCFGGPSEISDFSWRYETEQ